MELLKTLCGGNSKIWAGLQNGTTTELAKQTEVESLKTSVSSGKAQIASAITGKGVSTSSTASFSTMARNIQNIKTTTTVIQQISNVIDVNSMRYLGYGTYTIDANTSKTFSGNVHFFFFVSGAAFASFAIIYTVERKITTMSADVRNNWGSFSSNTIALPSKWRFGNNYPDATISATSNSLTIQAPSSDSHHYNIASFRK